MKTDFTKLKKEPHRINTRPLKMLTCINLLMSRAMKKYMLVDKLEVSKRTVERYFQAMRDAGMPLTLDSNGFYSIDY